MRSTSCRLKALAALALALTCLSAGCVRVKDVLTINADGSGTIEIETLSYINQLAELRTMYLDYGTGTEFCYPPLSASDAKVLFPETDFTTEINQKRTAEGQTLTIKASFKDMKALLASPYSRAHALWIDLDPDNKLLTLKALSGLHKLPNLDTIPRQITGRMPPMTIKGMKDNVTKLKIDFTVKLPAAVKAEAAAIDGNAATWTVDRSTLADGVHLVEALGRVMTATCSADAITFKPISPVRMELLTFDELREGPAGPAPDPVDAAKVMKAAKFVPLAFLSSRNFYFAEISCTRDEGAVLAGVITLPIPLAPRNWGQVVLKEVIDDHGNNLTPAADHDEYERSRYRYDRGSREKEPPTEVRKMVMISMKPPILPVQKLSRLEATIDLKYPGTPTVIKIKDALRLPPPPKEGEEPDEDHDVDSAELNHPKFEEFQLRTELRFVGRYGDMVNLELSFEGENTLITGVQFFDVNGHALATTILRRDEDEIDLSFVAGAEGPVSLALLLDGNGPTITMPISLKDIPITPNAMPEAPEPDKTAPVKEVQDR